ncbi:SusC/RagA family TonB-linked outer membrane protein [Dawidia soli]|uniref:TonB-dependent receptor n=1 Tax=Dawidia soli TaxID=2782352 RepID=A0AAP2D747_9BACT|nr:TonB-dependent receptor [Dawidia soli]MBT1685811.1 TonB-dependent receptor [Dawidia soli]
MQRILTLLIICVLAVPAWAQPRTITGQVTDASDGSPLPGVNVLVQGTSRGTATDVEGRYSLDVGPEETTLTFTFVGYKTQSVVVGTQTVVDAALEVDFTTLSDVVVIGYGVVKKSDLTGAVSSVRGADLTKVPAVSPMQALQGKVAGVQVSSSTGAPGAAPVVRIRGQGTFNDSSPIYVVDGVIVQDIDFLNAGDIESMEVLKDASSTAIYGARGANGVILITTKRGVQGQEYPTISLSAEYSVQQFQNKIDMLNGRDFATYVNQFEPGSYNNVDAVPNTDWQDEVFKTAPIQNYQFSAAGASPKIQYYIGLGYFKQDGIVGKSSYERITLKLNNTFHLSKNIRFGNNFTLTPYKQQTTGGNAVFATYRALPVVTPRDANGNFNAVPNVGNPLADIEYTNNSDRGIRGVGNLFGEVNFLDNAFTFRTSLGVDAKYFKNRAFTPVFFVSPQQQRSQNLLIKKFEDQATVLWENTLNFSKNFSDHHVDALVGFTMQNTTSEFLRLQSQNILRDDEDFWYFNQGSPITIIDSEKDVNGADPKYNYSMISYLARANYTYKGRYLFTATFRRDGSSKFTEVNRYADFPSVAVGWNIIEEPFLQDVTFLDNLKVRASWGKTGNEKIEYLKIYSLVDNGVNAVFGQGDRLFSGATYGITGNPELKWETTTQTDAGIEAGFLNNRLKVELDYYRRVTSDILIPLEVPGYLGNGSGAQITFNAGEIRNRGVEFNLNWESKLGNGLGYRVGAVGTTIHNEVLKIQGGGSVSGELLGPNSITRSVVGEPIGSFYGYQVDGLFQNQGELNAYPHMDNVGVGDVRFVNITNDNELDDNDRTSLGSPIPTLLYGISLGLDFKGFDLAIDFQGESGASIMNYKETVRPDLYNFESHVMDYWRGEGTSNSEPRPSEGGVNFLPSSRFVQSADFFRLRNVTLGYTVPRSVTDRLAVKTARVYIRGTNVFTAKSFTGFSPEIANENPLDNKVDRGTYPVVSIYSCGLNLTF